MRTSGRTSAASVPSLAATRMISCTAASVATTCLHARVDRARATVELLQQRDLVHVGERRDRVVGRVQAVRRRRVPGLDLALAALARDRARRARRLEQRRRHDLVGIGEAGALAGHRAHADALLDAVAAFLDDAVLERPVLLARELEVEVARVDARAEHASRAPARGAGRRGRRARGCARARIAGRPWSCQHPVLQRGEALARRLLPVLVERRGDDVAAARLAREHAAPVVRDQACRRRSRGCCRGCRSARPRSRSRGPRWRARAAAFPSARARSGS